MKFNVLQCSICYVIGGHRDQHFNHSELHYVAIPELLWTAFQPKELHYVAI